MALTLTQIAAGVLTHDMLDTISVCFKAATWLVQHLALFVLVMFAQQRVALTTEGLMLHCLHTYHSR